MFSYSGKSFRTVKSFLSKNTELPDKSWYFISGVLLIQLFYHLGFLAVYYGLAGGVDGLSWDMKLPDNLLFGFVTWFVVMGYGTRFFRTRYWILQLLMFIPFCVIAGYMVLFRSEMNAEMLNFFFRITWQDAADFTRSFLSPSLFYTVVSSLLTWLAVMFAIYRFCFRPFLNVKIGRKQSSDEKPAETERLKSRHFFVAYGAAFFLFLCLLSVDLLDGGILSQHNKVQIWNIQSDFITVFWSHIHKMISYETGGEEFAKSMDVPLTENGVRRFDSDFSDDAIVVLALGESASRFRLHAFGYERETTPFLSSLIENKGNISKWRAWKHDKTHSVSIATVDSVRGMFSFPIVPEQRPFIKGPDASSKDIKLNEEEGHDQKRYSVMKILNELGWHTGWFSNNHTIGPFDTVGIGPIYKQAQEQFIVSAQDSLDTFRKNLLTFMSPKSVVVKKKSIEEGVQHYDEELLPVFEDFLKSKNVPSGGGKKFAVLHLRGSHFYYQARYPSSFAVFGPDSELPASSDALQGYYRRLAREPEYRGNETWMEETRLARNFIDEYDNSILYTDYILRKITEVIDDYNEWRARRGVPRVPAAVIFLSDHGEDVYTGVTKLPFRKLPGTNPMFAVPFAVLFNDVWRGRADLPQHDTVMPDGDKYFIIPRLYEVFFRLMKIRENYRATS